MNEPIQRAERIRNLINAQSYENTWFIGAGAVLNIEPMTLKNPSWFKTIWKSKWGEIEKTKHENKETVIWHRPDGGQAMADIGPAPINIRIIRFALLAKLIETLKDMNQLSYVEVGLANWRNCKVLYGEDFQLTDVTKADALIGFAERIVRKNGKVQVSKEKPDEIETERISGIITILVEKDQQTIF